MLKTYEAIYNHGIIELLTEPPKLGRFKMLVVIEQTEPNANEQDAEELLAESFGAWGQHPAAEASALIESRRGIDWGDR
ncbi:MAG: hypothetical protein ABSB19_18965 [Methylomonas sp.]|jgi:hypothetical protein